MTFTASHILEVAKYETKLCSVMTWLENVLSNIINNNVNDFIEHYIYNRIKSVLGQQAL